MFDKFLNIELQNQLLKIYKIKNTQFIFFSKISKNKNSQFKFKKMFQSVHKSSLESSLWEPNLYLFLFFHFIYLIK